MTVRHHIDVDEWRVPEKLDLLRQWSADGLTLEQMGKRIGICSSTLSKWSFKYPEIRLALLEGGDVADELVKKSVFAQCFDRTEVEQTREMDAQGNVVKQSARTHTRPANLKACEFWLTNRKKKEWQTRQNIDITSDDGYRVVIIDDLATKPHIDADTSSE